MQHCTAAVRSRACTRAIAFDPTERHTAAADGVELDGGARAAHLACGAVDMLNLHAHTVQLDGDVSEDSPRLDAHLVVPVVKLVLVEPLLGVK